MATIPGYLLNSCTINSTTSGPLLMKAGTLITDPTVQAAIVSAGGQLGSASDPILIAAALIVVKMRTVRGAEEKLLDSVMLGAAAESAGSFKLTSAVLAANLASTTTLIGEASRIGTIIGVTVTFDGPAASGENQAFQLVQNGSNVTGAVATYSSTSTSRVLTIPVPAGTTYALGDDLSMANVYTAGGSPALGGKKMTILLVGTP